MEDKKVTEKVAEEAIEALVPIEALEAVDLSLPEDYEEAIMAEELLGWITSYHKAVVAGKAARHQEQHAQAENYSKQTLLAKAAAALIQHNYPNAKRISDELARIRALEASNARVSRLKEKKE